MSSRKSLRYNWKARQNGTVKGRLRPLNTNGNVGFDSSYFSTAPFQDVLDTNVEVLPSKKTKLDTEDDDALPSVVYKRKKLSGKQKKRLLKVIEVKKKKAKRVAAFESLASLSLPDSYSSLLQSSVQLGRSKKTHKQVLKDVRLRDQLQALSKPSKTVAKKKDDDKLSLDLSSLLGSTWRAKTKKRRRMLKIEKVMSGPRTQCRPQASSGIDDDDEDLDEDLEEGEDGHAVADTNSGAGMRKPFVPSVRADEESGVDTDREAAAEKDKQCLLISEGAPIQRPAEQRQLSSAANYVQLYRDPDIQCARLSLPILSEEQLVMETINENHVTVLCGETGSGKTTQVPQFLYEAGYTQRGVDGGRSLIGVTEPRRVAAVSMACRVAQEMGPDGKVKVAYQIRYEGTCTGDTEVKFMTDGVLLKEAEQDFLLSQYSVIIVDEAHERSVFTDILIGLLSRIVPVREKNGNPLKLVIMSATLHVEDFTGNSRLFPVAPPVVRVESRQYPVTIHFNRRTPDDYVDAAFRKTCKIHRTLQQGSILIFVTGKKEIHSLCRSLSRRFPMQHVKEGGGGVMGDGVGVSDTINLDCYSVMPSRPHGQPYASPHFPVEDEEGVEEEGEEFEESSAEDELSDEDDETEFHDSHLPMIVLPLYSLLSRAQQCKVFDPPPPGIRLCVVATNVAETSLTIPNVKYVVDTGMVKRRFYDKVTGISTYRVCWTSKASADQRAGRAGRTEPGHCYRLYSSSIFHNVFGGFSPPEITRRPVEDLVLLMKVMGIDRVANFPFPTPPSAVAINAAETLLHKLGALDLVKHSQTKTPPLLPSYIVSSLGKTMANFPLAPRYAKMLAIGRQHGCLPYVIALVSALSVREVFVCSDGGDDSEALKEDRWVKLHRSWVGKGESLLLGDLMVLLRVVGAWEYSRSQDDFCRKNGLSQKAMLEIRKLRQQLTNIVNNILPDEGVTLEPRMPPLSHEQVRYVRQIVLSGLGDHVAHKICTHCMNAEDKKKLCHAYQSTLCEDPVFLHSSSVLYYQNPEFVVFQEITETSKLFMRGVCAVEATWLPHVQPEFCSFSDPLEDPPPSFDDSGCVMCHMTCTYGEHSWPIGIHAMLHPKSLMLYKWFAMFLIQGKVVEAFITSVNKKLFDAEPLEQLTAVVPGFSKFSPILLVPPIALLKHWSKLHKQCEVLVAALANKEVCTRQKLLEEWDNHPKYLLKAYSLWLPESKHSELASEWPLTSS